MTGPALASADARSEERDLIRRARAGSLPAYDDLMRLYERRLMGFLLRRCASRHDAEDLVQETFLRAWQRLGLYDERWAFSTWLLTIAARLAITQHRRRRAERPADHVDDRPAAGASPADRLADHEEQINVWRLADRILTEEQRLALWLRYADDMPIKDIARVLGKSAVATRVMLFRARATLAAGAPEHAGPAPRLEAGGRAENSPTVTLRDAPMRASRLSTVSGGS